MHLAVLPAAGTGPPRYARHRPEDTLLYQLVERHYPDFLATLAERDRHLPAHVRDEFEAYLKCGRLEQGFLRVRCTTCQAERLVAFSCKRRGFCPSCGARRMVASAALLVDEVLPRERVRQWVLSVPFPLRFLFAAEPAAMGEVLGIVWRALSVHLLKKAGLTRATGQAGAVTLDRCRALNHEMVRSINEIGHLTGKKVIAEWAESQEVITMLRGMGVDYAQGYGISEPKRVVMAAVVNGG